MVGFVRCRTLPKTLWGTTTDISYISVHLGASTFIFFLCFVSELKLWKFNTMTTHNIVVFGGDHCGPEVRINPYQFLYDSSAANKHKQVVAEAVKVKLTSQLQTLISSSH